MVRFPDICFVSSFGLVRDELRDHTPVIGCTRYQEAGEVVGEQFVVGREREGERRDFLDAV